jgi:hypothetical protein
MPIRADNDPRFSRRFLIMGVVAIGFAFWSLYDGMVKYPAQRVRGFDEFKAGYKSEFEDPKVKDLTVDQFEQSADKNHVWAKYVHDSGIKSIPEIFTQYVQAAVAGIVGLFLLSIPLRSRGRWIEANESGITSSWGQSFQYDEVEQVNKRKWRDKGIAKVTYVANGRRQLFVIDDFKFKRETTDQILFELEQRIEIERITGGPPEMLPGEHVEVHANDPDHTSPEEPS